MSLLDKKVSEALLQGGVVSAPDKLTGTPAQNKAVFDRLMRNVAQSVINPVIDELAGVSGAESIGSERGSVKERLDALDLHAQSKGNPHGLTPEQIGADTPQGAQSKADHALDAAKKYTDSEVKKQIIQSGGIFGDDAGNAQNSLKLGGLAPAAFIQANPNLLDNSNFAINQRGGAAYNGGGYTLDRWLLNSGTVTVLPNGIKLSANSGDFFQLLLTSENKYIHDGVYTISAKIDGEIYSCTITLDFSDVNLYAGGLLGTSGVYLNTICNWDVMGRLLVGLRPSGKQRIVEWIKLEEGNMATPYQHPNPATELAKCQRHFEVIGSMSEPMYLSPVTGGLFFLPHNGSFKQKKRVVPTIQLENNALLYFNIHAPDQPNATAIMSGITQNEISAVISSVPQPDMGWGQMCAVRGKIYVNAEIY